ncbi:MAG: glycosyltransferase family 4 protein [Desulfobacteraceae bacterium]|nr:glycosyltransferase family 4 protein [Desulfobacteraceae bacterium]
MCGYHSGSRADDTWDIFLFLSFFPVVFRKTGTSTKSVRIRDKTIIPEVVEDNANGLLVAPKNVSELAFAIEKLVCDKELREKMGKIGKKIYKEKFTIVKMIEQLDILYNKCF